MSWFNAIKGYLIGSLILLGLAGCWLFASYYFRASQQHELIIGAGSQSGEAFQFALAIEELVERYHPDIRMEVLETRGSSENMTLLSEGKIQLATVQADIEAVPEARMVSSLYSDLFQLVVRDDADIQSFKDLKGKRIALPRRGGGQWVSFWFVAEHYGLKPAMLEDVQLGSAEALEAILSGEVDALFRVRAAPNQDIASVISGCSASIIPIGQGSAMQLKLPALEGSIIPQGAYRGDPPTPETDIPTVSVSRLLVAHEAAEPYAIRSLTQVLFERRRELLQQTPLAGFIRQPNPLQGTFIPLHEGAKAFYDREKPHFLVENADFFALLLSLSLVVFSAIVGLRSIFQNKQKNQADAYTRQLMELTEEIRGITELKEIQVKKDQLRLILSTVIDDLDKDRIRPEGFTFFSFTWNVAYEAIKEREKEL